MLEQQKFDSEKHSYNVLRSSGYFDSNESLILAEKATAFEAEVYEVEYEDYMYSQLAPVVSDGEGLQSVGYYQRDKSGKAKLIASGSDDIPNLNAKQTKVTLPVQHFAAQYGWDHFQLKEFQRMGMPLESDLAMDARDASELFLDDTFFDGVPAANIPGYLTNAALYAETVVTGSIESKTPDNVVIEFSKIIKAVYENTLRRHRANVCIMPVALMTHIQTRRMTDGVTTILNYLKSVFPDVSFMENDKLAPASVTTASGAKADKNVILAYKLDPRVLKYKVPVLFLQHPMQQMGLNFNRIVTGDIAGLEIKNFAAFSIAAVDKA